MSKARTIKVPSAGGSATAVINVTPLVDVVLVLLIIFMVVTPLLEKDIDLQLPSTEKVQTMDEVPPDQLVVKVLANGTLELNGEAVALADYVEKVRVRLGRVRDPAQRIAFFVADEAAPYGLLVTALDGARKAGATTLGMGTDEPKPSP
jgi:hypothetical protein